MNNYSILLVDDEELIRKTIGMNLKEKGYEVTLAENGKTAIKMIRNSSTDNRNMSDAEIQNPTATPRPFDLIITDLGMKEVGGIEVLKTAKEINPDGMVMILTGYGSLTSAIEAIQFKADDYILKPCETEELHFRVIRCLERLEFQRKIRIYENVLPVCCVCKSIRDDSGKEHGTGDWMPMEFYVKNKANIDVSHTFCPKCNKEFLDKAMAPNSN